jgi:hypothetical protein
LGYSLDGASSNAFQLRQTEVDWMGSTRVYSSSAFGPILSRQSGSSDLVKLLIKPYLHLVRLVSVHGLQLRDSEELFSFILPCGLYSLYCVYSPAITLL